MKKIIYCMICILLFSVVRKTEASTLQKDQLIQFQDTLNNQSYEIVSLDYPEPAKGWNNGVYQKRKLYESHTNKYFRIEQGDLVAQSQHWEEQTKIGRNLAYSNKGGLVWNAENADYEIEVTFENPTSKAYQVFVQGNGMLQTGNNTVRPKAEITTTFTLSVVYGKLELSFIVPQKVTTPEQAVWKEAYIKQIKIHKKTREKRGNIPTVYIAGDSTAATMGKQHFPREGWGQELYQYVKHTGNVKRKKFNEAGYEVGWYEYRMNTAVVQNRATSGESTNSFRNTGKFDSILNSMRPGDFVLVQFAHNDIRDDTPYKNTSVKQYKKNLRYFADGVKQRGGKCIFLSSVPRWKFTKAGKAISTALSYRSAMKQVAKEYNMPFLNIGQIMDDMISVLGKKDARKFYMELPKGVYGNYPSGLQDPSHFRKQGAEKVAQIIAGEIQKANIKGLSSSMQVDRNYYKGLSKEVAIKSIKKKSLKKIKLRWKRIKHARQYKILKYSNKEKRYIKIGRTKKTYYILKKKDTIGKYQIRANF